MIWNKAKRQEAQQVAHPAQNFEMSGQVRATAQALDQAAASIPSSQRPQLVTPIAAPTPPQPEARAASRTGAPGVPPGNGPGAGGTGGHGIGGPGNGGPGNGGPGGPGGPGGSSPFNHPVPPGAAKKMSEVLGEIVWLMSQSARSSGRCAPGHKQFFISDLEWPAAQAAKGISR